MILALNTSGRTCGVALCGKNLMDYIETTEDLRHNEVLLLHLKNLLARNQVGFQNLSAIAVSSGPGSFTGLRVGMATAKGLCRTLSLPLICVPTLEGVAASVPSALKRALPLIPARAREVYWCLYEYEGSRWNQKGELAISDVDRVNQVVQGSVILCGEGYERHQKELDDLFGSRGLKIPHSETLEPLVISTARLAVERFQQKQFSDVAKTEPAYFYPFPRITL